MCAHVGGDVTAQDLQVELGVAPLLVQCGRGQEERLPLAPLVAPSTEADPLAQRLARLQGHRRAAERRPFLGKSCEPLRVRLFGRAHRLLRRLRLCRILDMRLPAEASRHRAGL